MTPTNGLPAVGVELVLGAEEVLVGETLDDETVDVAECEDEEADEDEELALPGLKNISTNALVTMFELSLQALRVVRVGVHASRAGHTCRRSR